MKVKTGLKHYNYYHIDSEKKPIISCYLIVNLNNGIVAKGMALCSIKDNPCKREGRTLASKRAWEIYRRARRLWKKSIKSGLYMRTLRKDRYRDLTFVDACCTVISPNIRTADFLRLRVGEFDNIDLKFIRPLLSSLTQVNS